MIDSRPTLLVLGGLPGAGKTTLAREVVAQSQALHLSSDQIRAECFGSPEMEVVRTSQQASSIVYEILYLRAEAALMRQKSVVSDGMNCLPPGWARYVKLSERVKANCIFVDIIASKRFLRRRVAERGGSENKLRFYDDILTKGNELWATKNVHTREKAITVRWQPEIGTVTFARGGGPDETCVCESAAELAVFLLHLN